MFLLASKYHMPSQDAIQKGLAGDVARDCGINIEGLAFHSEYIRRGKNRVRISYTNMNG